jgi:hypothetical protein
VKVINVKVTKLVSIVVKKYILCCSGRTDHARIVSTRPDYIMSSISSLAHKANVIIV